MARDRGGYDRLTKEWSSIPASVIAFTSAGTAALGVIDFNEAATVLRMLGEYTLTPSGSTVALDAAVITVGIGKVSTDAATLGATALPDPGSEPNFPWLYWASHSVFFGGTSVDPNSEAATIWHSFDVRTMRKFKPRETLQMVAQYDDVNGAPPVRLNPGITRVLVGLH